MYIDPFAYEPLVAVGLPPPVLPGGINGSTSLHSSSVRSLGYRNSLRSYRARFLLVHIGDPSSNQATTLESQMIHMIQELSGRTLSERNAGGDRGLGRDMGRGGFQAALVGPKWDAAAAEGIDIHIGRAPDEGQEAVPSV